jgi:tetratricopeptide (TPR) repeat protein
LPVQERLADLLALLGDRGAAMELYATVNGGYRTTRATVDQARIARKTGTLHWQVGDRAEAMASYRRALEQLSGSTAHVEAAHLYQELGLAAFRSGDNQQAIEWSERALQSAERALNEPDGDTVHVRTAATTAGRARDEHDRRRARAIGPARRGARADRAQPRHSSGARTPRCCLPCVCESRRHLQFGGTETSDRCLAYRSRDRVKIGAASLQSYIYANLATAYCALTERCDTEGLEAANAAAAIDRELGQLDHLAVPLVVIGQIHQCRGELHKAESAYREALVLAEKIGEPQLIVPCYDGLATIHLDRGDRVRAEELMERARQLCERTGLDPDTLLLLPFLG